MVDCDTSCTWYSYCFELGELLEFCFMLSFNPKPITITLYDETRIER